MLQDKVCVKGGKVEILLKLQAKATLHVLVAVAGKLQKVEALADAQK